MAFWARERLRAGWQVRESPAEEDASVVIVEGVEAAEAVVDVDVDVEEVGEEADMDVEEEEEEDEEPEDVDEDMLPEAVLVLVLVPLEVVAEDELMLDEPAPATAAAVTTLPELVIVADALPDVEDADGAGVAAAPSVTKISVWAPSMYP